MESVQILGCFALALKNPPGDPPACSSGHHLRSHCLLWPFAAVLLLPMAKYLWVHPLSLIYLRALMCSTLMWGCLKILGFPFASMSVCLSVCFCSVGSPHAPFPSRPHQPRPHPCITATITTLPCEVLCWLRARGLLGNTLDIRFHFPFFPISTV